jgi:P-type Ca2+ transporter type 2B
MIMDSLGALALATEMPKEDLLDRMPYKKDESIISGRMVKHILGMSIYQIIVIYAIVFGGEHFFPEPDATWRFERAASTSYIYPGRLYDWDSTPLYQYKTTLYGPSRHMTNVFNIFVILQIFNMICCRKVNDEKNIFDSFFKNRMFFVVLFLICLF